MEYHRFLLIQCKNLVEKYGNNIYGHVASNIVSKQHTISPVNINGRNIV